MLLAKEQLRDTLKSWTVQQKRLYPETGKNTPATRHPPARTSTDRVSQRMSTWLGRCVSRTREQFGQDTYVHSVDGAQATLLNKLLLLL